MSGGGKSALSTELRRRGFPICPEPGRQVVKEQLHIGGDALPWADLGKFVELTISRSMHFMMSAAQAEGLAFFDRGVVDQVAGLEHVGLPVPDHLRAAAERCRYHEIVFMLPPWREIFQNDAERRHGFDEAASSYATLCRVYERFGYQPLSVPKLALSARADFVLEALGIFSMRTPLRNSP